MFWKILKKTLKWAAIVLSGLILFAVVGNAVFIGITGRMLESRWAAIHAAGEPVCIADLAQPPIPPEKNAATYLQKAEVGVLAIYEAIHTPELSPLADDVDRVYPMPPELQKAIQKALDAHRDTLSLLERAAACPDYDTGLNFKHSGDKLVAEMLLPELSLRDAVRTLHFSVCFLVTEKKYDEAMRTTLAAFRLSRHARRIPGLIGYLIHITCREITIGGANLVLQTGSVSPTLRSELDAELAAQGRMDGLSSAFLTERAMYPSLARDYSFQGGSPFNWWPMRGLGNLFELKYLDKLQSLLTSLQNGTPYRDIAKEYVDTDPQWSGWLGELEYNVLFSGFKGMFIVTMRNQAEIRALRVLNALQTHAGNGKQTPKLTELGLPAETITDPFNGKPLIVKKQPNGWLIYSVGENLKDDGGNVASKTTEDRDYGVAPPKPSEKKTK